MGYAPTMFDEIGKLPLPSREILDVGAQDVTISSAAELEQLNRFVEQHNPGGEPLRVSQFPVTIEAREVYTKAGFTYTCIDVDERPGTLRVDLARFEIPRPRGKYGLVVNVGTTEHLASPAATFAIMHEMCAEGGMLYHDVPLFGLGNHGLMNPTPKFWHALIWMNGYAVQSIRTRHCDESGMDGGNFFHDYLDYMESLGAIKGISHLITVVLRKDSNWPFVVPYDAVFGDDAEGKALASLLIGSYHPFVATGAYSENEVVGGINHFLEMNGRSFRLRGLGESASAGAGGPQAAPRPFRNLWRNLLGATAGASKAAEGVATGSALPEAPAKKADAASPSLTADEAVTRIAELIQGEQIAGAIQLADDALASFPCDWRIHQQKARALEQMPPDGSAALQVPLSNLDAAKHFLRAASLAATTDEFRPRAPALVSMGRAQLQAADVVAAKCFPRLMSVDGDPATRARPQLIVLSTLPKSASAYIWMSLSSGLGFVPTRVSVWTGADDSSEIIDSERLGTLAATGGYVVHGHFCPAMGGMRSSIATPVAFTERAINTLDRLLVHVRDPRQTVVSWAHFMADHDQVSSLDHNSYAKVLSHLSLEDRIDWAIDWYLPRQIEYLHAWMDGVRSGRITATVKFVKQEDLAADAKGYFDSILDFYSIDRRMFTYPKSAEVGKLHFRSGKTDEWRDSLSAAQVACVQKRVSAELLDFFGWQR